MAYFNRDNRSGDRRKFGKPRFTNNRPDMHKATCASCGNICEVPFRPTGAKPVYCKDCFQKDAGSDSHRTFERPNAYRTDSRPRAAEAPNYKAQLDMLNAKMDKILELLTSAPIVEVPAESELNEEIIDEIVEAVEEEKKESVEKKPKTKKASSAKK